jgi:hypothetical protein
MRFRKTPDIGDSMSSSGDSSAWDETCGIWRRGVDALVERDERDDGFGLSANRHSPRHWLRPKVSRPAHDALTARLIERAGFHAEESYTTDPLRKHLIPARRKRMVILSFKRFSRLYI